MEPNSNIPIPAKDRILQIIESDIHRDGIHDLVSWLKATDFFSAPASTRYHGAFEGGLAQHSLAVWRRLNQFCCWYSDSLGQERWSAETIAIVALFHDVCKIGCYKTEKRWRKDQFNRWEQYEAYKFDEDFHYGGHGSKSVYLVQNFIKLTPEEAVAINCHMGQYDCTTYSNPTPAFESNHLAWLLHVADEAADFLDGI